MTIPAVDAVALTRDLVRMDTINPPGREQECARSVAAVLEGAGFRVREHEYAEGRTSLIAHAGGDADRPPICLTGHLDTVPLGARAWAREPLAGERDGDQLYGRGSSDMKSGIAAMVAASAGLAARLEGTPGVVLVLTAGEETGCDGAFAMARQGGVLGRAGAVVVGEPTANRPVVGHKGALWLEARTRGVTAHGSMPEQGVNAIYKAARVVAALESFRFSTPPHGLMGQATLNVGMIRGGLNFNSVPDEAVISVDIRTVPGVDHAALVGELQAWVGDEAELSPLLDVGPVFTEPAQAWVQEVFDVVTPILGERPDERSVTYFTDAAALMLAYGGPPTVILGPGEPQLAHQTDEWCSVRRIEESVAAYGELIRRWCGL